MGKIKPISLKLNNLFHINLRFPTPFALMVSHTIMATFQKKTIVTDNTTAKMLFLTRL